MPAHAELTGCELEHMRAHVMAGPFHLFGGVLEPHHEYTLHAIY